MTEFASAPEAPLSANRTRPKVVYILGAGRSGSTVLGVTLGNCAEFFYAGEVDAWLPRHGVPQRGGPERTPFWNSVRDEVEGADELFGNEAQRSIERSLAVFRVHKWPARRRLRARYRRVAEELYHAIARTAEATHVVDTSHYPLRARELQALEAIELYLVFLVRDPQGVVASFDPRDATSYSKSTFTTNAYLWLTHLLSLFVFLRHPRDRRLFLRHEDFLLDPEGVLRQILDWSESSAAIPDLTSLRTGIPLQANRFTRSSEVIALKGPSASPARRSRMTALLQLPWAPVFSRLRPVIRAKSSK